VKIGATFASETTTTKTGVRMKGRAESVTNHIILLYMWINKPEEDKLTSNVPVKGRREEEVPLTSNKTASQFNSLLQLP